MKEDDVLISVLRRVDVQHGKRSASCLAATLCFATTLTGPTLTAQSVVAEGTVRADGNTISGEVGPFVVATDFTIGNGRVAVTEGGRVFANNRIEVASGDGELGLLTIDGFGSGVVSSFGLVEVGGFVNSVGLVRITGGGGLNAPSASFGGIFASAGESSSGRLEVSGFGSELAITADSFPPLELLNGSGSITDLGQVSTPGRIDIGGGADGFQLEVTTGARLSAGGDIRVGANSAIGTVNRLSLRDGGVADALRVGIGQGATLEMSSGLLFAPVDIGPGSLLEGSGDITGSVTLAAETVALPFGAPEGRLLTRPGDRLRISSEGNLLEPFLDNAGTVENRGELEVVRGAFRNTGRYLGFDSIFRGGPVDNITGGRIDFLSGSNFFDADLDSGDPNDPDETTRVTVSGGASVVFGGDVINNAELRIETASRATFLGDLSGAGPITGSGEAIILGSFSPGNSPALVSFGTDLTLGSGSTTNIEIGGTARGTEYDAFDVGGTLTLAGTLSIQLIALDDQGQVDPGGSAYTPQLGDQFDLFNAGAITGSFSEVLLPSLSGGLAFDLSALETSGVVTVVPEPAVAGTLGVLVLAFGSRRLARMKVS